MRKKILLIISLSALLGGCTPSLPTFPEIVQCQLVLQEPLSASAWVCVNVVTKASEVRAWSDPRMNHAQAMTADDYLKSEQWVSEVKAIAEKRCK